MLHTQMSSFSELTPALISLRIAHMAAGKNTPLQVSCVTYRAIVPYYLSVKFQTPIAALAQRVAEVGIHHAHAGAVLQISMPLATVLVPSNLYNE